MGGAEVHRNNADGQTPAHTAASFVRRVKKEKSQKS